MGLPNVFATVATGAQEPGSALDANFNAVGQMGVIYCTASGTNAITLTPVATPGQPNITVYNNMQLFSFVPIATSTGSVTAQVGSLSFNPVYIGDTVTQAGANSIKATNQPYLLMFLTALNAGAGGFIVMNPTGYSGPVGVTGFRGIQFGPNLDSTTFLSNDPTTNPNNWTVSGTVATNDIVNLKITYTPQGGSQKTVTVTVNVTAAISGASGGSPFVLNGFSATNPQYAICLQMQQNFRTNATLLADFGANFIAPPSFTALNIALNNFPSVGTSTFQFNFRYPEVATAGTTFQATVTTGAETVTPSAATTIPATLEINPLVGVARSGIAGHTASAGDLIGGLVGVSDDSIGTLDTQYMNLFTRIDSPTSGAWQSTVTLGSGNWPLGTGSAALQLGRGLYLGSANTNPTGGDPGANNVNIAGSYQVQGGQISLKLTGGVPQLTSNIASSVFNFGMAGGNALQIVDTANIVNTLTVTGAATGIGPAIGTTGTDTNIPITYTTKGTGSHGFLTGGGTQFSIIDTLAAVNRFRVTGAATGNGPTLAAIGTDANVPANITSKGTASIFLATGAGTQIAVLNTASVVNQMTLTGSATGTAVVAGISGSDSNVDFTISAKGTGVVNLGTTTATTATAGAQTLPANPAGFINIKVNGTAQKVPFYNT